MLDIYKQWDREHNKFVWRHVVEARLNWLEASPEIQRLVLFSKIADKVKLKWGKRRRYFTLTYLSNKYYLIPTRN